MEQQKPAVLTLENGVRVAYYRVRSESVAMCIAARAGSAFEPEGKWGLAHLVEHMIFKGNEFFSRGELDKAVELSGGEVNAYTTRELVVVCAEMVPESLVRVADYLVKAVVARRLSETDFENEKRIVMSEAKGYTSNPETQIFRLAAMSVWGDGPLGRPIEGYPESLGSISLDNVIDFKARAFSPERLSVAIVGSFSEADALEALKKFLAVEGEGRLPEPEIGGPQARRITEDRGLDTGYVSLSYPMPPREKMKELLPSLRGLIFNLEAGATSILFRRLREARGLAYSHAVEAQLTSWGGTLSLVALEVPRDRVDEALQELENAAAEASKSPGSGDWLEGRRRLYRFLTRREAVSNTERADVLSASLLLHGEPTTVEELTAKTLESPWTMELPKERGVAILT